ncbi:MAG: YihY/virulence factor BrkB family protein [Acidimicrobiaceae bacterium]|nr:YihY/virulence factor BrkB family protein [Acidimicrobiaceae bacterium]
MSAPEWTGWPGWTPEPQPQASLRKTGKLEPVPPASPNGGAPGPRAWRSTTRAVLARVWHKLFADRILGMAAEAGFWAMLSLPSLALALFGALGYFHGVLGPDNVRHIHDDVLRGARDILTPSTVNSDVAPLVNEVLNHGHLGVISVGFVISLWSGSSAMSDYVNTITVAYDMRHLRGSVRSRVVATWLYLLFVLVGLILLPALALGPNLIINIAPDAVTDVVSTTVHALYWPVVAALSVALLAMLYKLALPVKVSWRRGLPGAVVAMALWLAGSFLVRTYLSSSFREKSVYGSLSAPIAALLFFYVTALAVLVGAELNSAIDAEMPTASTLEGRARDKRRAAEGANPGEDAQANS